MAVTPSAAEIPKYIAKWWADSTEEDKFIVIPQFGGFYVAETPEDMIMEKQKGDFFAKRAFGRSFVQFFEDGTVIFARLLGIAEAVSRIPRSIPDLSGNLATFEIARAQVDIKDLNELIVSGSLDRGNGKLTLYLKDPYGKTIAMQYDFFRTTLSLRSGF